MSPIRTILCPTDFSDHSGQAFRLACSLARDYGARLLVLHAAEPPVLLFDEAGNRLPHAEDYREAARKQMPAPRPDVGPVAAEYLLADGEAAAAILAAARQVKADLIVMGTQGRSGVARALIGSVAEDVLRKAPCPVLTVRLPPGGAGRAAP
jgi:nucleotide-binding universal stress UspA family protein